MFKNSKHTENKAFPIKKYSLGVAAALIGVTLAGGVNSVEAEEAPKAPDTSVKSDAGKTGGQFILLRDENGRNEKEIPVTEDELRAYVAPKGYAGQGVFFAEINGVVNQYTVFQKVKPEAPKPEETPKTTEAPKEEKPDVKVEAPKFKVPEAPKTTQQPKQENSKKSGNRVLPKTSAINETNSALSAGLAAVLAGAGLLAIKRRKN